MPEQADSDRSPRTPLRKRSLRRKLLFSTVAVLSFLVLLVIADRVVGWCLPPKTESLLFPSGSRVAHLSCEFDVTVEISEAGIRDREYSPGKPPVSTFRIVAVGDSFTFGWGVAGEKAWPNVLEQRLNENGGENSSASQRNYEVLNFGFPGASPHDYQHAAAQALEHFRPHLLIVGMLQGDDLIQLRESPNPRAAWTMRLLDGLFPTTRRLLRGQGDGTPMKSYHETFLRSQQYIRSQFTPEQKTRYQALSPQVRRCFENGMLNPSLVQRAMTVPNHFRLPIDGGEEWRDVARVRMSESLSRIQKACAARKCRLVVAIIPNGPYVSEAAAAGMREVGYSVPAELLTTDVPDQIVRDVCASLSIPCLEQTTEFRRLKQGCFFSLDGHFNATGHERFASKLAGDLTAHVEK